MSCYPDEVQAAIGNVVRAGRGVVEGCDLHRADYSSVEWAALSKLREAVAHLDGLAHRETSELA